jgi:protein-S-isoprenylcysteine O-methyltransferase Ste14
MIENENADKESIMEKEKIFKKHDNRNDLAGEYVFGDIGQAVLFLVFLVVWITDSFFITYSVFITDHVALYIRIPLSIIVIGISGYLAKSGLTIVFAEVREEPTVIRKGVFHMVRHPIYLGAILFYLTFLIFSFSIMATFVWIITASFYLYLCKHEEKLLLEKYGKDYEDYISEVPMLIPWTKKKKTYKL